MAALGALYLASYFLFSTSNSWQMDPAKRDEILSEYFRNLEQGAVVRPVFKVERMGSFDETRFQPAIEFKSSYDLKVWTGKDSYVRYRVVRRDNGAGSIEGFQETSRYPEKAVETISVDIPLTSTDQQELLLMLQALPELPRVPFYKANGAIKTIVTDLDNWLIAYDGRPVLQHKLDLSDRFSNGIAVEFLGQMEDELIQLKQQLAQMAYPESFDPNNPLLVGYDDIELSEAEKGWIMGNDDAAETFQKYQQLLTARAALIQRMKKTSSGRFALEIRESQKGIKY